MVGHSEDRVVVQTSWRRMIPSGQVTVVPFALRVIVENDLFKYSGQVWWLRTGRHMRDPGQMSAELVERFECEGEFFQVLVEVSGRGNDVRPLQVV